MAGSHRLPMVVALFDKYTDTVTNVPIVDDYSEIFYYLYGVTVKEKIRIKIMDP